MKQFNYLILMAFILGMAACKKDDTSGNDAVPVTITVKLAYNNETAAIGLSLEKAAVKLTNLTTNQVYNGTSATDGVATFKDIAPGNYNVSVVQTITAADYNAKAGTNVADAIVFNGILSNQSLVTNSTLAVTLITGRVGDLVIKQIYYSGSNAANGALYRDQFLEIYNNSSETIYADSLYFGQTENTATELGKVDLTKTYFLSGGQYDWTKSVGMSDGKANTDYVYMHSLFMIPGTGKQHPILPGASIIIAATAQNHQSPYTDISGKAITIKDPSLTVDLSKAEFEVYLGDQNGINPLASDVDNPNVTNVTVIDRGGVRDLIFDVLGRDGLVIFKSKVDPKTWSRYPSPDITQVIATTNTFIQVPLNLIIDGVGLNHTTESKRVPKYMNNSVDAGEIYTLGGSYSSEAVVRKVSKTNGSRIVLKDTNNSSNDFGVKKADATKTASSFVN